MPLALIFVAAMLIIIGIRGNYAAVGAQAEADIIDPKTGYIQFLIGIIGIGAFFRLIGMPNAGKVFLGLVLLAWIMQNKNVITALQNVTPTASGNPPGSGPHPAPGPGGVPASPTPAVGNADTVAGGTAGDTTYTNPPGGPGTAR